MDYKKKIIEVVEKVDDLEILMSIYSFVIGILSMREKREAD